MLLTLFSLFIASSSAAIYKCTTEFGESVPLRIIVDKAVKSEWNQAVENDPSLTSKVKRVPLQWQGHGILFDYRYAKRAGPSFEMNVECSTGQKCAGNFVGTADPKFVRLDARLFDTRAPDAKGYAELNLSDREVLDLRVRVYKHGTFEGRPWKVSASGEHMILEIRPKIIHDVGADEYLELVTGFDRRIAALEIKIRCDLAAHSPSQN